MPVLRGKADGRLNRRASAARGGLFSIVSRLDARMAVVWESSCCAAQGSLRAGALKSVAGLDDVHIDAETVRSIYPCIGEILDTKSCVGVRDRIDEYPGRTDDLNRTAEVLSAILVPAEKSGAHPDINGHESVLAAQGKARNNGRHQSIFACRCQYPRAGDQSCLQIPRGLAERAMTRAA